jgi:DNA-binding beta-propeller fold protein YncE
MGQLRSPHALAFDNQDYLYVADRGNSRVVVFEKTAHSHRREAFGRPSGLAITRAASISIRLAGVGFG